HLRKLEMSRSHMISPVRACPELGEGGVQKLAQRVSAGKCRKLMTSPVGATHVFLYLLTWLLLLGVAAHASPHLLNIKLAVTNPSEEERRAEPIVIPISELRK